MKKVTFNSKFTFNSSKKPSESSSQKRAVWAPSQAPGKTLVLWALQPALGNLADTLRKVAPNTLCLQNCQGWAYSSILGVCLFVLKHRNWFRDFCNTELHRKRNFSNTDCWEDGISHSFFFICIFSLFLWKQNKFMDGFSISYAGGGNCNLALSLPVHKC